MMRAFAGVFARARRAAQVLIGHESIAPTERYCAVDDSEIRAAMEAASA
jgi:site-specific recombinase XerD